MLNLPVRYRQKRGRQESADVIDKGDQRQSPEGARVFMINIGSLLHQYRENHFPLRIGHVRYSFASTPLAGCEAGIFESFTGSDQAISQGHQIALKEGVLGRADICGIFQQDEYPSSSCRMLRRRNSARDFEL